MTPPITNETRSGVITWESIAHSAQELSPGATFRDLHDPRPGAQAPTATQRTKAFFELYGACNAVIGSVELPLVALAPSDMPWLFLTVLGLFVYTAFCVVALILCSARIRRPTPGRLRSARVLALLVAPNALLGAGALLAQPPVAAAFLAPFALGAVYFVVKSMSLVHDPELDRRAWEQITTQVRVDPALGWEPARH